MIKNNKNEFNFKNADRLINVCILEAKDITNIIENPLNIQFNLIYPAYILGKAYLDVKDNTIEPQLNRSTTELPSSWVTSSLDLVRYLNKFVKTISEQYGEVNIKSIQLEELKGKKFNL